MLTYQPFELFQVLINANFQGFQDIDASKGYQYYQAFYVLPRWRQPRYLVA